ncbi:PaaI family thioesterase [Burkholderia sp. Bp9031]|uniref:PaaI family thioesterase n=2 Tax=Burkholderia TaxID=32008 RepID=UPI002892A226|nr:PaaI family thioesterase [Burkholderia sp. Bp9031]
MAMPSRNGASSGLEGDSSVAVSEAPCFDSPFVDSLGIERVTCSAGTCEVVLPLRSAHMNAWGIAHGGISMTLSDISLALAARSVADSDTGVLTIELKISFIQAGRGQLYARGRLLHRSAKMAYCEGEIVDGSGLLVAKSLGTFKYATKR